MKHKNEIASKDPDLETVLVLQGGGSLGAYECGAFKALDRHNIQFDIVSGTSIGAINAAIIAASKNDNPSKDLEGFWTRLIEKPIPSFPSQRFRAMLSSAYSSFYGNPNAFTALWSNPWLFGTSFNHPYLYDTTPIKETLEEFVDFGKLTNQNRPRLIVTSTDIKKGMRVVFDSKRHEIKTENILASIGYPFYGIAWTEINGRHFWDGALLNNTPLIAVMDASPKNHKIVFVTDLFPHEQDDLPKNMMESWHRARDIMFADKTQWAIDVSKRTENHLDLMQKMHGILEKTSLDGKNKEKFEEIEQEYHRLVSEQGAVIKKIIRIERKEDVHYLFEDADFSSETITKLIEEGEKDAEKILQRQELE
ncbi:MAG: patatin-like phospholipase family protein [Thaumarchaeota archaeon]|nr:patatin-like phospholipase family protein [Nitrososphaerota archaeon]